jgi:hypothetical protein
MLLPAPKDSPAHPRSDDQRRTRSVSYSIRLPAPAGALGPTDRESSSVRAGSAADRRTTHNSGQERSPKVQRNRRSPTYRTLTSCGGEGCSGVRVSSPGCRESCGLLPTRRSVTEDGPHPLVSWGAVAARCEASSLSPIVPPACHKQRSPAVSSGQPRSAGENRCAAPGVADLGDHDRPNCMECKRSC